MHRIPRPATRAAWHGAVLGAVLGAAAVSASAVVACGQAAPSRPAASTAAPPTAFAYAPGTQHYRVTTVDTRTQDQAGGRAPFEFANTTTEYVTMTIAPRSRDTLALALTLDSVGVTSTLDAPPADTGGLRGKRMDGTMSPQGRLYVFAPPAGVTDPKTVALYRAFRRFVTALPAQIGPGASTTDTTTDTFKRGEFDVKTSTVTTTKVVGDTTYAGQHAWRVEKNSALSTTGEGRENGKPIHLDGEGNIRSVQFVSTAGVLLGSTATQTNRVQMSIGDEAGGSSAPIQTNIKSTVEAIPAGRTAGR